MSDKNTIDFRSTDHWHRKKRRQWLFLAVLAGITALAWGLVLTREAPGPAGQTAAAVRAQR
ncbi:MAG: hypothetical protein KI788_06195 [Mameliella sp.]|nr:hypothetical protein [Mameliella sp.]